MLTFKDEDLINKLRKKNKTDSVIPARFHAFGNIKENVKNQVQKIKSHPWIPKNIR